MATKEGRELMKDAISDARALKDVALESAKKELIDQLAPGVKALLEAKINKVLFEDKPNEQNAGYYNNNEKTMKFQEEKGDQPMDDNFGKEKEVEEEGLGLESLSGMFSEVEEPEMPKLDDEEDGNKKDDYEDFDVKEGLDEPELKDESIEISESELRKVYEAALQTEAQVSKGFKDMTAAGELEQVAKDAGKGLNKEKSGEHPWEKETPPAMVDYQIKEAISRGIAENKMLRGKLKEAVQVIKRLASNLHEVNLFNAKVLHVNKILSGNRLTTEQKNVVLESIDKAKSISQVKMVYETVIAAFKSSKPLTESRKPQANAQRNRTSGAPDQKVLSESVNKSGNEGKYDRMQQLAGLLK